MTQAVPEPTPRAVAERWMQYFNDHDVDSLVQLYDPDGRHCSPRMRELSPNSDGELIGQSALARWWKSSLLRTPGLSYETLAIVADESTAFVQYIRHAAHEPDTVVVERFDVQHGKIVSSRVFLG